MTMPAGVTGANFDEAYYLANSPDVAAAMLTSGTGFGNGWDHFNRSGHSEGRLWRVYPGAVAPPVVVAPGVTLSPALLQRLVPTPAPAPFLGGILEGEIFGISKPLLLIGGLALWFLMSDSGAKRH